MTGKGIKEFFFDIFFPKFCLNCSREGDYLCYDCFSLVEIADRQYCPFCTRCRECQSTCLECSRSKTLGGLYCATSSDNFVVRKIIKRFTQEPFAKDLSSTLASFIIAHLHNSGKIDLIKDFSLCPVPIEKKELKYRGFNPSEEIAKELSSYFNIPLLREMLQKKKDEFSWLGGNEIRDKNILLVNDSFGTEVIFDACAQLLKTRGAKKIWGAVIAK